MLTAAKNLAVPIAFIIVFKTAGTKPAVLLAVLVALAEIIYSKLRQRRIEPLFLIAAGFTIVFGSIDVFFAETPGMFKLQPAVQNGTIGSILLFTALSGRPFLRQIAEKLPEPMREGVGELPDSYFTRWAWILTAYFYTKAMFFYMLAGRVDLAELIVFRSVLGGGSLLAVLAIELTTRKKYVLLARGKLNGEGKSQLGEMQTEGGV